MERNGIWGVYVIMNALAIFFNLSLVISIWRLKDKKTSTEVLIGGLSSGIILAAMGCGPQCLMSAVLGDFAFGNKACFAEAFLHLVGMEIQFICVASISHRTYVGVVTQKPYPARKAVYVVAFAWVFAVVSTSIMGNFSRYYLVASGTFCFYEWTSPALLVAAWPMAILSIGLMAFWYWKTFQAFRVVREGAKDIRNEHSSAALDRELAIRLSVLVLLFGFGYIGIISQSLYEITIGRAKAWGDIVAALMVLIYWDSIAFFYAQANKRLGLKAVFLFFPTEPILSTVRELTSRGSKQSLATPKESGKSAEETDAVESLVKFQGLAKYKGQHSPDVELANTSCLDNSMLGESTPRKFTGGIERLEGPREYMPFFPVDTEESVRGSVDREDGADEPAKQIFNPFTPSALHSPSESGNKFDFNLQSSEPSTPHEAVHTAIASSRNSDITVTLAHVPLSSTVDTPGSGGKIALSPSLESLDKEL